MNNNNTGYRQIGDIQVKCEIKKHEAVTFEHMDIAESNRGFIINHTIKDTTYTFEVNKTLAREYLSEHGYDMAIFW